MTDDISHMMKLFVGLKTPPFQAKHVLSMHSAFDVALGIERALSWVGRENDEKALWVTLKYKETWTDTDPEMMLAYTKYRLEVWHEFCKAQHIFTPWQHIKDDDLRAQLRQEQYEAHYA